MPLLLRIEMIVLAVIFLFIVIKAVNKKKLWLQYSLVWVIISVLMLIVAVFPGIANWMASIMQIETTSNLIYLLAIFALLILTFSLTVIVSKQSQRIKNIVQMVSIEKYLSETEKENKENGN